MEKAITLFLVSVSIVIFIPLFLYYVFRLISKAWYRSQMEELNNYKGDKDE